MCWPLYHHTFSPFVMMKSICFLTSSETIFLNQLTKCLASRKLAWDSSHDKIRSMQRLQIVLFLPAADDNHRIIMAGEDIIGQ